MAAMNTTDTRKLDEFLSQLNQLPMLSVVVQEVIASFKSSHLDRSTLANKISQDQGLSAKVLRVANSPFFGLSRKVGSIQDAALVMGFDSIRSLALSAGFVLAFPNTTNNNFDRKSYWLRSFRVAGYCQALAKCLGEDPQKAFTVGMFHEIGLLVFDVCIAEQFGLILARQKISGANLIELEQSELGFDHAIAGAEMARRWNFPLEIEHAIRYWRTPEHEPFEITTGIVHVAVLLESGLRGTALINLLPVALCDRLQLTWDRIKSDIPEPSQLEAVANKIFEV
jgi:HD-like signal output (HDOD) protein